MKRFSSSTWVSSALISASLASAATARAQTPSEATAEAAPVQAAPASTEPATTTPAASSAAEAEATSAATGPSESPAEVPARKMDLSVPTPPPAEGRKGYSHNGLYVRFAVGPGWQWTSINDRSPLDLDVSGNGFGLGADLLIGGCPSPGIALGVGALSHFAFDVDLELDDTDFTETNAAYLIIGPFFDAYPDNKKGWHLGGELGFAYTGLEDVNDALITHAYGGGVAAWVGHDWWVAQEWSAGLNLRLAGAYMFGSRNDEDARASDVSTTLLVTVLYN